MISLGIGGTENSHAEKIIQYLNGDRPYPELAVTALTDDSPRARELADTWSLALCPDAAGMAAVTDAGVLVHRRGSRHFACAEPYARAGKPLFIDKPFASDPGEAQALARLLEQQHCPVLGGSNCPFSRCVRDLSRQTAGLMGRGALAAAELSFNFYPRSEYDGFYFYAPHLLEICLSLFGTQVQSVTALKTEHTVTAVLQYPDFPVTLHFLEDYWTPSVLLLTADGPLFQPLDTSDGLVRQMDAFYALLKGQRPSMTGEELVLSIRLLDRILKAADRQKTI